MHILHIYIQHTWYRIHIIMILDRLQFVIYILSIVNNTILYYYNTLFKYCMDKYNSRRYYIIKICVGIYTHTDLLHHLVSIYIDEHTAWL